MPMETVGNEILNDIKMHVEGSTTDDHFDPLLVDYANVAFTNLFQMGVGPKDKPFKLTLSESSTWSDFSSDKNLESAKEYIYRYVQLLFDPPQNSNAMQATKDILAEAEWRANTYTDYKESFE